VRKHKSHDAVVRLRSIPKCAGFCHLPAFFASAAANSRSFAIVLAAGSLRLLFFCRRLALVV